MRHEPSFLKDILSACRKIQVIVAATSEDIPQRRGVTGCRAASFDRDWRGNQPFVC
jgi:hypothetical protein